MSKERSIVPRGYGQKPAASPAARTWTVILGLVCLGGAAFLGRETWAVSTGARSWLQPFIDVMSQDKIETWMLASGGAAILVGLLLLVAAFKPRKSTHTQVESEVASIWLRPVDIARAASAAARRVPGVAAARSRAVISKKKITVDVTVNGDTEDEGLISRVEDAVAQTLQQLHRQPQLTVAAEKLPEVDDHV
ncbi:DUF6286 domain-containing protein [Corynebacterium striatum]|uniref:DUF6286 domain-containing protein n=1 Tax=Corynebacterium striatum TaxID=43770 RepID=UPI000C1CC34F|nr:DUF6286 domain-containing protein [Corynebacterium striatum]MBD0856879.1 hypothetical protein [Corynebacterium striatum]PIS60863.1 hypothetical protein AZH44_00090 [Corynebacterium striatum]PXY05928.1 hypothetical protein CKF55_09525 [Corynebacterium striatum]PXY06987.1 hypothetical protein CKF72_11720 [Corynebacterium striatum]